MKITFSILFLFFVTVYTAVGQPEGMVTYEMKMNLHRNIPKDREDMKAMIPEFNTTRFQLLFNHSESLYKTLMDEEDDVANSDAGGRRMVIMRAAMKSEIYFHTDDPTMVSKQEFMGKEYLITDTVKVSPWKFGSETKTIAGYACRMAYYTDQSRPERPQEITAWFTDQLRPFLGPERFNTLPGTVLAVDINNGERVIVAKSIDIRALRKNELKKPGSGTPVSGKEFREMMEKRMKEMRSQGGNFTIRN